MNTDYSNHIKSDAKYTGFNSLKLAAGRLILKLINSDKSAKIKNMLKFQPLRHEGTKKEKYRFG